MYYYAPPDGIAMKLEELDEKTLYNLYVKVNQAATRLHTERILGQLRQQEQLRRLQNLQRPPQVPRQPVQPPKLPQDYIPPQPPRQPPAPPPERR